MENYIGIIIAIENYHFGLSKVNYALNDGKEFREALIKLGCDPSKLRFLSDNLATKTTILACIKELSQYAMSTDTIIFYFAGHGFYHDSKNLISCVDTSLTALGETTVDINSILAELDKSKSQKVIAFLDCCHSGIEFSQNERSPITDFLTDELKYAYRNAEHLTVFASCKSNEKSQTDSARHHGAWSYFLINALSGNAKGIYDGNLLFSDKLQKYLAEETYHRVKIITTAKKNQTPVKYGKETPEKFIVADLSKLFSEKKIKTDIDKVRFEKATIITVEEDWVRNLPDFEHGHTIPKKIDSYHEEWIKKIASSLIKEELNDLAKTLREKLRYKRKDIEKLEVFDGIGELTTIEFDYVITVTQSKEKADKFILTRTIENFKNSDILNNDIFNEIFDDKFDALELRLNKALDVRSLIDRIEEIDREELINVDYEAEDQTKCKIYLKGFDGHIVVSSQYFSIQTNKKKSPQNLIQSFKEARQVIEQYQNIQKIIGQF